MPCARRATRYYRTMACQAPFLTPPIRILPSLQFKSPHESDFQIFTLPLSAFSLATFLLALPFRQNPLHTHAGVLVFLVWVRRAGALPNSAVARPPYPHTQAQPEGSPSARKPARQSATDGFRIGTRSIVVLRRRIGTLSSQQGRRGGGLMSWEDDLLKETPRGLTGGEDTVPGARWADPDALDARWAYDRSSFFLGYRQGRNIGCRDDRHVLLVAGSRAGKGVSLVIPNLLLYEGSVLAIDPKGELARATSKQRRKLGEVVILDPFNTTQAPDRAKFNPLAEIDPDSETAVDDAARLAEALIIEEGGGDKHWINGARELVKGFILFALRQKDPALRTLVTVRNFFHVASAPDDAQPDLIDGDGESKGKRSKTIPGYRRVLRAMAKQGDAFGGLVAAIGSSYDTKDERELAGLVSTA